MSVETGRVLVTGASGLIGREILRCLVETGREVHAVARRSPETPGHGAIWHLGDLLDGAERRRLAHRVRPDALVHCAWHVVHGAYWTAAENGAWVGATVDLAKAFARVGTRRFLGIGTCAEYDWSDEGLDPWPETRPCRPGSLYGQAKLAASREVAQFAHEVGLSFAWARIFHTFAPHEPERKLVASLCHALAQGRPARCLAGHRRRDYLDVADVGRAVAAVLMSDLTGAVNIGRGASVTLGRLAETLGRLAGRPDLVHIGSNASSEEPVSIVADIALLANATDFRATPLDEGLLFCLDHWRMRACD